jgi:hypothetical protein
MLCARPERGVDIHELEDTAGLCLLHPPLFCHLVHARQSKKCMPWPRIGLAQYSAACMAATGAHTGGPGTRARCARQVFGRRQTFWDMIFGLLGARDKSLPVILLELVATVVVNFTAGLTVSVFAFLFQARAAS